MGKLRIALVIFALVAATACPIPAFADEDAVHSASVIVDDPVEPDDEASLAVEGEAAQRCVEAIGMEGESTSEDSAESVSSLMATEADDGLAHRDSDVEEMPDGATTSSDTLPSANPDDAGMQSGGDGGDQSGVEEGAGVDSETKPSSDSNADEIARGKDDEVPQKSCDIAYNVKGGDSGWQGWKTRGKTAGSRGAGNCVSAIRIKVENPSASGSVQYQLNAGDAGWQRVASDGEAAKAGGQYARAIRVALTGKLSRLYSVKYRVSNAGGIWGAWKKDGAVALAGGSKPIGALQVKIVKRENELMRVGDGLVGVHYRSRGKGGNWQEQVSDGDVSGAVKPGASLVRVEISVDTGSYGGGVSYKACVNGTWDKRWKAGGQAVGAPAGKKALEGIKVRLTGGLAKRYDVLYRVSVAGSGWQDWTYNGRVAGLAGKGDAVQAFWVKLVKKGSAKKVSSGTYRLAVSSKRSIVLSSPRSTKKGAQARSRSKCGVGAEKFQVRYEGDGFVSLQSVSSGLFLGQSGDKVVQLADKDSAKLRWKTFWDDGFSFVNAATGKVLTLSKGKSLARAKAVAAKEKGLASQRWWPIEAKLVDDGYYRIASARGLRLAIAGGSYSPAASMVASAGKDSGGKQVFRIYEKDSGRYVIESARSFLAVSVSDGSKANRANVVQDRLGRSASQLWKPSLDRSGYLSFVNAKSGKVLEVAGSVREDGANVRQNAAHVTKGQLWKLSVAKPYSLSGDEELDRMVASTLATRTTLRAVYEHVAFDYRYISANEIRGGRYLSQAQSIAYAKEFERNGGGNCYRFSSMMAWLARGLGYSARVVTGWVPGRLEPRAPHGWCEVLLGGSAYVCDPDMYNAVRYRDWYLQTYASAPVAYGFW